MTTVALVAYAFTGSAWLIVPVALDYVMRTFMNAPMSPMARAAKRIAAMLGLSYRPMGKAAKVFASRIGVLFAPGAAIAHFAAPELSVVLALSLAGFTFAESALDFCVGCVVYTYVALPLASLKNGVARPAAN